MQSLQLLLAFMGLILNLFKLNKMIIYPWNKKMENESFKTRGHPRSTSLCYRNTRAR